MRLMNSFQISTVILMTIFFFTAIPADVQASRWGKKKHRLSQEEKRREDDRKYQLYLKALKKLDPKQHEILSVRYQRQKQVRQVVSKFKKGKLDFKQAKKALYPSVKAQIEEDILAANRRIERMREQIEELELSRKQLYKRRYSSQQDFDSIKKQISEKKERIKQLQEAKAVPDKLIADWIDVLLGRGKKGFTYALSSSR